MIFFLCLMDGLIVRICYNIPHEKKYSGSSCFI